MQWIIVKERFGDPSRYVIDLPWLNLPKRNHTLGKEQRKLGAKCPRKEDELKKDPIPRIIAKNWHRIEKSRNFSSNPILGQLPTPVCQYMTTLITYSHSLLSHIYGYSDYPRSIFKLISPFVGLPFRILTFSYDKKSIHLIWFTAAHFTFNVICI